MTDLYTMTEFEEGWSAKPYLDTEGFPTVGFGFRIGPKGAPLAQYQFMLPRTAGEVWLRCLMNDYVSRINAIPAYAGINAAYRRLLSEAGVGGPYADPRICVLLNMAHQMGLDGLAAFVNTLAAVSRGEYSLAADSMLASKWAKQTPVRAKREAEIMRTGQWPAEYPK